MLLSLQSSSALLVVPLRFCRFLLANNQPFVTEELRCKPKQPNLIEAGPGSLGSQQRGKVIERAAEPDWLGEVAHSGICVDRPVIEGKEKRLNLDQYLSLRQE